MPGKLSLQEMLDLFDRHFGAELAVDLDTVMATMVPEPYWDAHPDGIRAHGAEAVRANYAELLQRETKSQVRRYWADEERQEVVFQFNCEADWSGDGELQFSTVIIMEFEDGLIKGETVYASVAGDLAATLA